jgi:hypothetical protein
LERRSPPVSVPLKKFKKNKNKSCKPRAGSLSRSQT